MLDIATTHYALKSGIGTKANESVSGRAHRMGWRRSKLEAMPLIR